jgi:hypothetical protein
VIVFPTAVLWAALIENQKHVLRLLIAALGNLQVLTSERKHGWIAMMREHNATTTMECWSPDELPNLSFSHIWSASPSFVIPWFLGGVRPLAPGYAKVAIKPQPGPLRRFDLSMPTVKGPVHSNVSQTFGQQGELTHFKLQAVVPGNVAAVLHVPRNDPKGAVEPCVVLNGRQSRAEYSEQGAHMFVEVASGTHTVEWCT